MGFGGLHPEINLECLALAILVNSEEFQARLRCLRRLNVHVRVACLCVTVLKSGSMFKEKTATKWKKKTINITTADVRRV